MDKRREGYDEAVATLTQELMGLLAELKQGVPFFSGRYKGHMVFEQTIASQVGYFAAMLYNPNNVAIEASPVTTRLELEVGRQLAGMIGYDPARPGGTSPPAGRWPTSRPSGWRGTSSTFPWPPGPPPTPWGSSSRWRGPGAGWPRSGNSPSPSS
jgi:hypothetical protein